jgi:outer membrane protein TolC
MRRVLLIVQLVVVPLFLRAQQATPQAMNLEQCIQYALENSIRVKNAELDQDIARAKVNETIGIGLPQISGNASVVNNPKLPRFFATYNGPGGFLGDLSSVPGLQVGDAVAAKNPFQLPSSGSASVSINQLIFNGSYLVGLKASSTFRDLATKTREQTEQDVIQLVTKAYYSVLINKERIVLFDNNIARVDSLLQNTKALNTNGFAERIDVDRVKVSLNNLNAERDKFLNLNELGIQLLKFQMGYPQEMPLDVVGSIKDVVVDSNVEAYEADWDYRKRPDYKVLEVNQRLQQLNIKNQYAAAVPVISAFANLGYQTQSPNVPGVFTTNTQISDANGLGPDKWYNYSQVGVNLSVPLFTGLSRTFRIQQEKLKLLQINNGFVTLKNAIDLEVTQSSITYKNALKSLGVQKENQELASNVAQVTKIKYEQGVGSSLEVTDAENSLRQAQTNYYAALFDAMVAKVDLDKAYGKLLPSTYKKNSLIKPETK